ncbi:SPOR domain-containing protein [Cribrihabitans neustonicus]|uniref:SPOR domain-containing protein n=1 Tax=Cribrihabitans neustonicus TaxID=1429085 RepID=UPI003B58CE04
MAYFAQAGSGRPNMQGGDRERDTAFGVPDGPQYTGPGAEPNYGYDGAGFQGGSYGYHPEGQAGDAAGEACDSHVSYGDGYDGYEGGYPPPPGFRARAARILSLFGAAASIALVAGVGVWGYKLVMRDVSGVPVVRAVEGPMRVQPDNPGGAQADHQGLAVNAVAAQGSAAPPAERLTLAPPSIKLTDDDKPLPELAAEAAPKPAAFVEEREAEDSGAEDGELVIAAYQDGGIDALVAELTRDAEPLSPQNAAANAADLGRVEPAAAPSPALLKAPGLKQSLRPATRPARLGTPPSTPVNVTPVSAPAAKEVDAESLAPGTRLAQLGAYESAEVARAEWDRIAARFPGYLDSRPRVIQRATSGGRTFYRLRVMGFDGLSDARRFCSALVAGNADCIPVTTR